MGRHSGVRIAFCAAAAFAAWAAPSVALADDRSLLKIGVLAYRGEEEAARSWAPTADYLTARLGDYRVAVVPMLHEALRSSVERGEVDFVLTNTGHYVELEAAYGISRIATLKMLPSAEIGSHFGAVIFTRADRADIRQLADLKGKTFAAVALDAFGGFQMAWREFRAAGVDPLEQFSDLYFLGLPQDRIVQSVMLGEADAGTVRSGLLEAMAAEGLIQFADFRVLNRQNRPDYPLALSTRLYPEWPFATLKRTPAPLAQRVAVALLELPADSPAAREGRYAGWTIPLDYQPVHDMFRELGIGPYATPPDYSLEALVKRFRVWLASAAALFLAVAGHSVRSEYLVARRTRELSAINEELGRQIGERRAAEEKARRHRAELAHVGRVRSMGEMASVVAHEINQPLSAILSYAQGCVRRLRTGSGRPEELAAAMEQVAQQARRAGQIIARVRGFVRPSSPMARRIDVNRAVRDVAELVAVDAHDHGIALRLDLAEPLPRAAADLVEIEQVVFNLARNAIDALSRAPAREREIVLATRGKGTDAVLVSVSDNGPGVAPQTQERLFESFFTTKPDGLGLGLAICQSIVGAYGGSMWMTPRAGGGAVFSFTLPVAQAAGASPQAQTA